MAADELKELASDSQLVHKLQKKLPVQIQNSPNRRALELKFFLMQANRLCLVDKSNGYASAVRLYHIILVSLNKVASGQKLPLSQLKTLIAMERRANLMLALAYLQKEKGDCA